ncbi:MAG: 1,4-alpha-glucan branching protein GlgB, partial [Candidatus Omnitrophota bacterium]
LDNYSWQDEDWIAERVQRQSYDQPISIYEVHLGSWLRDHDGNMLGYREIAPKLAWFVSANHFTHVEILPLQEHFYYRSWGYLPDCFYAPTSRYGSPQDLMYLVDYLHRSGIGVILDWVPGHYSNNQEVLLNFDGSELYSHHDPRQGFHPDWGSRIFNHDRTEVKSFLVSNALFWLEKFHLDGLRVDGVASMLYRDFSRQQKGLEWVPNIWGGRENFASVEFLRQFNTAVHENYPGVLTFAEESSSWPGVSRPVTSGGLGFDIKWSLGWMNDTLEYMRQDPCYRPWHHHRVTFYPLYAFSENFLLPLSHDEVSNGKGSLWQKMPGSRLYYSLDKLDNLRLLFGLQWLMPGKKLLFMGQEFGQRREWNCDYATLREGDMSINMGLRQWIFDLNLLYGLEPALHELDFSPEGFSWINADDYEHSVFSFMRRGKNPKEIIIAVFNCSNRLLRNYRIGAPLEGGWKVLLNSDGRCYAGDNKGSGGTVVTENIPWQNRPCSLSLDLPPLGALILKYTPGPGATSSRQGYFGNLLFPDHMQFIEPLIAQGQWQEIDNFNGALQIFEGVPVRFRQFTAVAQRAPPYYIYAKRVHDDRGNYSLDAPLEIYFSSAQLVQQFTQEFQNDLNLALEAIAFHEVQEYLLKNTHEEANRLTQQRYPTIYPRLQALFAHIHNITMRPAAGQNVAIRQGEDFEVELLVTTSTDTMKEHLEIAVHSDVDTNQWHDLVIDQQDINPGVDASGRPIPGTWFARTKIIPQHSGHYQFTSRAKIKTQREDWHWFIGGNVFLQVHNMPDWVDLQKFEPYYLFISDVAAVGSPINWTGVRDFILRTHKATGRNAFVLSPFFPTSEDGPFAPLSVFALHPRLVDWNAVADTGASPMEKFHSFKAHASMERSMRFSVFRQIGQLLEYSLLIATRVYQGKEECIYGVKYRATDFSSEQEAIEFLLYEQ